MFKGSNDESSGSIGAPSFSIFVKPGLSSKDTAESGHNTHLDLTKNILQPLDMCANIEKPCLGSPFILKTS